MQSHQLVSAFHLLGQNPGSSVARASSQSTRQRRQERAPAGSRCLSTLPGAADAGREGRFTSLGAHQGRAAATRCWEQRGVHQPGRSCRGAGTGIRGRAWPWPAPAGRQVSRTEAWPWEGLSLRDWLPPLRRPRSPVCWAQALQPVVQSERGPKSQLLMEHPAWGQEGGGPSARHPAIYWGPRQ